MKTRMKTSIIWRLDRDKIEEIVKSNTTFTAILKYFGLTPDGGNVKTLKKRLKNDAISFDHISQGRQHNKGRVFIKNEEIPLKDVLVENSNYDKRNLKKRLLKESILENKCCQCGLGPTWNGKSLTLQLDHINGDRYDNRLDNLRILCPNCHTQTSTFGARNKKKIYNCIDCGISITRHSESGLCRECITTKNRKVKRPNFDVLIFQVEQKGYTETAKIYGVSDNAIRKWIKQD